MYSLIAKQEAGAGDWAENLVYRFVLNHLAFMGSFRMLGSWGQEPRRVGMLF